MARPTTVYDDALIEHIIEENSEEKNRKFREYLVELKTVLTHNIGDPYLYIWAWRIRTQKLGKDYDHITVITGKEGTGKSTLASKLCVLVTMSFPMVNVCYEPEDFIERASVAKKGDTLWVDEGGLFFFSRDSMSTVSKELTQFLTTCRQLNLHIIICIPNFFILESYIREHRVHSLFHVLSRGSFKYFREDSIFKIALFGKLGKNVMSPRIKLSSDEWRWGSFNSYIPCSSSDFNKDDYIKYKSEGMVRQMGRIKARLGQLSSSSSVVDDDKAGFVDVPTFSKLSGLNKATVRRYIHKGNIKFKEFGGKYLISRKELEFDKEDNVDDVV